MQVENIFENWDSNRRRTWGDEVTSAVDTEEGSTYLPTLETAERKLDFNPKTSTEHTA